MQHIGGNRSSMEGESQNRKKVRQIKVLKEITKNREIIEGNLNSRTAPPVRVSDLSPDDNLSVSPLDLIHEEAVWEEILDYLVNPEDVTNAYYTCELFRRLLQRKRVNSMLPKILAILKREKYLCYDVAAHKNDILNLRRISKVWRDCVENLYFQERYLMKNWHVYYATNSLRNSVSSRDKVNKIISTLPHANHIIFTRELTIVDPFFMNENAQNEFYFEVENLLVRCGDSIWGLVCHTRRPFHATYNCLQRWCAFLPNLKALRVKNLRGYNMEDAYIDDDMRRENLLLIQAMAENRFPNIPSLRHFEAHEMPGPFASMILANNPGIRSLEVSEIDFEMSRVVNTMHFDRFSMFKFHHHTSTYFVSNPGSIPFSWPLKKLQLHDTRGIDPCSTRALFQFIQNYGGTLEELEACLVFRDNGENEFLHLPDLKRLKWKLNRKFLSIDFIAPLKSLENLTVVFDPKEVRKESKNQRREVIQFKECLTDFKKSNIWKYFPTLKVVKFINNSKNVTIARP